MTPATTDVKRKTGEVSKAAAADPLSAEELRTMHAYWRAANYLSVGPLALVACAQVKRYPPEYRDLYRADRDPCRLELDAGGDAARRCRSWCQLFPLGPLAILPPYMGLMPVPTDPLL
jgi:hypothetical protein